MSERLRHIVNQGANEALVFMQATRQTRTEIYKSAPPPLNTLGHEGLVDTAVRVAVTGIAKATGGLNSTNRQKG